MASLKGLRKKLHALRLTSKDLESGDQQFRIEEQALAEKRHLLTVKSQMLRAKSQILSEMQQQLTVEETPYQQLIIEKRKTLTENFDVKRQASEQVLKQKKADLTSSLTMLTVTLEAVTSDTENKLLMQLGNEMADEHPDWPGELKKYLRQADLLAILKKMNAMRDACKQLENGLKRELGGSGYNVEQFLSLMERNVK